MRILILFLFVSICNLLQAQNKTFIDQPYVQTLASVDTSVVPDRFHLSLLISENHTKGNQSVEEVEHLMKERLEGIGIDLKEQLFLSDLYSNYINKIFIGRDIVNAKLYKLIVYDAKTAADVIIAMEEIPISKIDLDKTEFSRIETLKLNLKSKAINMAHKQAEIMASALDQSIGKAIFISDIQKSANSPVEGTIVKYETASGFLQSRRKGKADPLEFEKIKVESKVLVKFILY